MRHFSAISPEELSALASAGGVAVHRKGTGHRFTEDESRVAGKIGGRAAFSNKEWLARFRAAAAAAAKAKTTPVCKNLPYGPGVYAIKCHSTGDMYIGSSACANVRVRHHVHMLQHGTHYSTRLQQAFETHGVVALSAEMLETTNGMSRRDLTEREFYWIEKLQPSCNTHKRIRATAARLR